MSMLGNRRSAWKVQRALLTELPGLGKPGAIERRPYPPGQHGLSRRKFSEYGIRLQEKQKLMFHYGLREEQLRRLVVRSKAGKADNWMGTLISHLEIRLDNVIFRLGFAGSIAAARQLISHGKVLVNGKRLDISSAEIKVGSTITLTSDAYQGTVYHYSINKPRLLLPDWLECVSIENIKKGRIRSMPAGDSIPFPFEARLVAEFYRSI